HCTFCFYPRSSSVLRALEVDEAARLVRGLRERGAREVVFLDPTFNHRPGFVPLLDALAALNRDRALSFFAEVRAEGLTADHATRLRRAGFTKLEIGLQSVNRNTLKRVRRGGSPQLVAQAARMLHDHGIELLVDLIVGLPGDGVDDVLRGIDFLQENGLGGEAQVFPLSLLPGTAMRATGAQHAALWIRGKDLFARHDLVLAAIEARLDVDPYATLDVVLAPGDQFPIDLLDRIRTRLDAAPASYASRALQHRGENLQ